MKKYFITIALLGVTGILSADDAKKSWMKDQQDQTDTYAVPLDSSEEEEKAEMQDLDALKKKLPTAPNQKGSPNKGS